MSADLPHPPDERALAPFVARVELETAARVAMRIDSPWLVPVRSWDPVVHAAPPPSERPTEPLSARDAATCLIQLCDVVSRAHAAGWAGFAVGVRDVRLVREGDAWRIAVVLPHLPAFRNIHHRLAHIGDPRVRADLRTAALLFVDLAKGTYGPPWELREVPDVGDPAVRAALDEVLSGDGCPVTDAAGLAALVLPLAPELAPVVAGMPRVAEVRVRHDWDRLVALGEAEVADRPRDAYLTLPLAAAYHQRAVTRRAAGDLAAALVDLDRAVALDPGPRNLATRAMVRRELADPRAIDDLDEAIHDLRNVVTPDGLSTTWLWRGPGWDAEGEDWRLLPGEEHRDMCRALYVRAVWRIEAGDRAGATADLDMAWLLLPDGPSALRRSVIRALVPIRRAEAREDGGTRARWRFVRALVAVGRVEEARVEAEPLLTGAEAEVYRGRWAKLVP